MDYEETMVDNDDFEADDTLPEEIVEEDESEEEDLEEYLNEDEEEVEEQPAEEPEPQASEPGWIKKRVAKEVEKAVARTRAEMQAMFEEQMAPIREKMIEDQAQELVRTRKVGDIETARELVRLRQGQTVSPEATSQQEQPRNEQGQYISREDLVESAKTEARIDELRKQAQKISAAGGPDVIAIWNSDEDIKMAVINGEMDFYDVAELSRPKKRPPSPTRSPNGVNGIGISIENMSDAQFRKLDKMLDEGKRFTIRR